MAEVKVELNVGRRGEICTVELRDRKIIDELQIQRIGERLTELAQAEANPRMLLDFRGVEHLSSAALSVLITLQRLVDERGGRLVLANIHPQIFEVFRITRLNKLLTVRDSMDDALEAVRA